MTPEAKHSPEKGIVDPDLIICARGEWHTRVKGTCEVITADHKRHYVTTKSYHKVYRANFPKGWQH